MIFSIIFHFRYQSEPKLTWILTSLAFIRPTDLIILSWQAHVANQKTGSDPLLDPKTTHHQRNGSRAK